MTACADTDPVQAALVGHRDAQGLIAVLRSGCALPDQLHTSLQALRAAGDGERLRACTRELQKALEAHS